MLPVHVGQRNSRHNGHDDRASLGLLGALGSLDFGRARDLDGAGGFCRCHGFGGRDFRGSHGILSRRGPRRVRH